MKTRKMTIENLGSRNLMAADLMGGAPLDFSSNGWGDPMLVESEGIAEAADLMGFGFGGWGDPDSHQVISFRSPSITLT